MSTPEEQLNQANDTTHNEVVKTEEPTLPEVARKRAIQAAAQSLCIDVGVGVALVVVAGFGAIDTPEALTLFGVSVGKTVVITAAQWTVRRYLDKSGFNKDGTRK